MIQVTNLTKTFGTGPAQVRVLKEVDLHIRQGEMVSITGPSGCGKSTLLHVLSGIEPPTEGQVIIDGFQLHSAREKDLTAFRLKKMGFIFQSYHLIPVLTAEENVALPLIGQGISSRKANEKARHALNRVGLADKASSRPAYLSGGQNQRVAIARAIAAEPNVIWADEPTGALDSQNSEQVVGLLRHINETMGTAIVIVTHDAKVAAQTDRIIRMENGRILHQTEMASNSLLAGQGREQS